MKKIVVAIMALCLAVSLFGCGSAGTADKDQEIVATVITNSGETKQMTFDQIKEVSQKNAPLFSEEYYGASVEFSGKIMKIGDAYSFWGIYNADAYLEIGDSIYEVWFVEISKGDALKYNVGDTVQVKGILSTANGGASFDRLYVFNEDGVKPTVTVE